MDRILMLAVDAAEECAVWSDLAELGQGFLGVPAGVAAR
jgi:hypothetical protein